MEVSDELTLPRAKALPLLGRIFEFAPDPIGFMGKNFERLGENFFFHIGPRKLIATSDPLVFEQVLQLNHRNYSKDFAMHQLSLALGRGLLTNEGESWWKQRRLAQPAFYKKRLDGLFDVMYNISDAYIQELKSRLSEQPTFIDKEMMALTSDIAIITLLGTEKTDELIYMQQKFVDVQEHLIKRIRNPFFAPFSHLDGSHNQFNKIMESFDKIVYRIIDEKKKSVPGNDLITMLLEAKDADTGEGMSDKQLRDELITMYVAGHETSGYTLAWAFYAIGKHPEVYARVKAEVNSVFSKGFQGMDTLKELVYTRQIIDETLRLYPTAYLLSRLIKGNDQVNGIALPEGHVVLLSTLYLHRNKKYWQNPETFNPDRFGENGEKEAIKKAYYPFGGGPRMCIGNHFALMETTLVLGMMMYHFDFTLVEDQKIDFQPLVTLKPRYGIQLTLRKSKN